MHLVCTKLSKWDAALFTLTFSKHLDWAGQQCNHSYALHIQLAILYGCMIAPVVDCWYVAESLRSEYWQPR
jgi:hypothetical protein